MKNQLISPFHHKEHFQPSLEVDNPKCHTLSFDDCAYKEQFNFSKGISSFVKIEPGLKRSNTFLLPCCGMRCSFNRPSEIRHFYFPIKSNKEILRFDVSMDNVV